MMAVILGPHLGLFTRAPDYPRQLLKNDTQMLHSCITINCIVPLVHEFLHFLIEANYYSTIFRVNRKREIFSM